MSQAPSMPLFCGDYLKDTPDLTLEEHGAYLMILMYTWANGCTPMPDDDERIARRLRIGKERWVKKIRPSIEPFFDLSGSTWRSPRLEKEWKYVSEYREKQSKKGKASAENRKKSPENSPICSAMNAEQIAPNGEDKSLKNKETTSTAVGLRLQPQGQPEANTQPQPHTEEKRDRDKSLSSAPDGSGKRLSAHPDFEEWYRLYPLKKDPQDAAKAYAAARKKGASEEELRSAAIRYAAECAAKGTEKKFIKHPSTWLNKGSWQNEPDLLTPNNGNQNVHKLDLARTYRPEPDLIFRALSKGITGFDDAIAELDNIGTRAY